MSHRVSGSERRCPRTGGTFGVESAVRACTAALAALLAGLALAAPPAKAQMVSEDLVRNMSQATSDEFGFLSDVAQAFTTGGHAAGYRLTSVSLRMGSTESMQPTYTTTIREDNSGVPGATIVGTLTNPSALSSTRQSHVLTAPGGGIDLAANTTYWVELVVNSVPAGTDELHTTRGHTRSHAEDAGAAAGWSIADHALARNRHLNQAWSITTPNHTIDRQLKMIIEGYPIPAGPSINRVGVVSAPSHDADGDGHFDTYIQGDRIDVDVQFTEPVEIAGDGDGVRLRLDLGADDTDLGNSRMTLKNPSVIHGGLVLRFAYTVTAADTDADGVWVQTASGDRAVFLAGTTPPTVTSADTGIDAILTATGLPVTGDADRKVDGSVTSVPGPRLESASVNADTLTLTFNEALATSADTAKLAFMLSVKHAGDFDRGSPSRYQHPTAVTVTNETTGGTTRGKVTLTLGVPAHAGDEVWVSYQRMGTLPLVLKDTSNNLAPTFWQVAVTNATPGTAAPTPLRAALGGSTLRVVFTQALDAASAPAGSAFKVHLTDRDHDRRTLAGTGTARVSGRAVTVTLAEAVRTDELGRAEYAKPATGALRGAGTGNPEVKSWERGAFLVERVVDIGDPEAVSAAVSAVSATDSRLVVYFDEALDGTSTPAAGDFSVELTSGTASTVSQVEVANQAVMLQVTGVYDTANQATVSYTRGTTSILDLAGNAASAFSLNAEGFAQGKPALQSATADGVRLVLAFDKYLRPSAVPPTSAFSFHHPLRSGQTDRDEYPRSITAIGVEGKNMVLHLNAPVTPCATFEVSYDKTDTPRIQALDGQQPDAFTHQTVTNARAGSCVRGGVGDAGGQAGGGRPVWEGKSVTLGFEGTLDTRRALDASAFATSAGCGSSGASAPKVEGASYTSGGAGVELTLDRAAAGGETVTLCYAAAHSATGLWDRDGNQIAGFSVEVTGEAAQAEPPSVTAVAVVSDAGGDATYALGETLRVRLTFSEAVDVDTSGGAPRLSIDMDPAHWGTKQAAYEGGSGTAELTFAHTVVEPNESTQGIAVLADTLALNGGTIRSTAGTDADLAHGGLGHDPAHKVDWRRAPAPAPAPAVIGVAVVSDAGSDATYALGETVRVRVTFDEAVAVTGAPRLSIDMDPAHWGTKQAAWEGGSGTDSLTFAYTVAEPNESTQGIAVLADTLALNGGTIRSAATGADAGLSHAGLGHDPAHKVDWQQGPPDTTAPAVASAEVDRNKATVTFDEELAANRNADLWMYWQVESPGLTQHPARMSVSGKTVTMHLSTEVTAGQSVSVIHEPSGIRDAAGNRVPYFKVAAENLTLPTLSVADARTNEGPEAEMAFAVRLNAAMPDAVTVDYATADGTARAGEDYTAASGTLTFAAGETGKTVSVAVLDDALDEGRETFRLKLSNAVGARIADGEATGTIVNSDPLQKMWLSRFGRTVADHVTGAVSDRLAGPRAGAGMSVGGQSLDLARMGDEAELARTLTALARAMGAAEAPESGGDGWRGAGLDRAESPALSNAPAGALSGRALLLGSAFHLGAEGDGGGPGLGVWGRVTAGGFDGEAPADAGRVRIDGDVTTGILGADAEWERLLAGVAVSFSDGEGTFDQPGVDSGTIESTMTTVSPYARLRVGERVSVWGLAGLGTGDMTIVQAADAASGQRERSTRTDLEMRLGAVGARGALTRADETGGMDLALKADAFFVETEWDAVSGETDTAAGASRVRLALEASRAFETAAGGVLTPGLELGLRHDGGDAETGTGVELGGRIAWADAGSGLSLEASVRTLVAHEDAGYEEWGASGAVRLAPGASGRGLSFRLAPTWGVPSSGAERLWSARDARGLAPEGEFTPESRLEGEVGYGVALFGGAFTGTPYAGLGLSDTARDYRLGWRLTPAGAGDGFSFDLEGTRREGAGAGAAPEHGVMLRGALRW